jgi:hypothetical protein
VERDSSLRLCDPPSIIHPQHRLHRGRGYTIRAVAHADARLVSALLVHSKTQASHRAVLLETTRSTALYRTFLFFSTVHFLFNGATASTEPGPSHNRGFTITLRHTTFGRTPLYEWLAPYRDLNLYLTTHNTHNRQKIHAPGGIRTRFLSQRPAAHPRLRPRGHWGRRRTFLLLIYCILWRVR